MSRAGYVLMGAYDSLQSVQIHLYKYILEASFVGVFDAPTPTSPPLLLWDIHSESDGHAANGDEPPLQGMIVGESYVSAMMKGNTYHIVILAANRAGIASRASANADHADGRAVEADERIDILNDDADSAEQSSTRGRVSLLRKSSARLPKSDRRPAEKRDVPFRSAGSIGLGRCCSRHGRRWGRGWRPQGERGRGWRWLVW